jgi:hypothetical protein
MYENRRRRCEATPFPVNEEAWAQTHHLSVFRRATDLRQAFYGAVTDLNSPPRGDDNF